MTLIKLNTTTFPERLQRIKRREMKIHAPVLQSYVNVYLEACKTTPRSRVEVYRQCDFGWRVYVRKWNANGTRQTVLRETEFEDFIYLYYQKNGTFKKLFKKLSSLKLRSLFNRFWLRCFGR